jgi:hypothetical protein
MLQSDAGTSPFPVVPKAPPAIAWGHLIQPKLTDGRMGSPSQADKIVLTTDVRGHKVYIGTGPLFSVLPSPVSRPLAPTPPSAP